MKQAGQVIVAGAKRRVMVGCLSLLIGVPVMSCCLFGMWTYFLPYMEQISSNQPENSSWLLTGVVGLLIVGLILFPAAAIGFLALKRARMLDGVFTSLGLQGEMYMIVGRHYWGQIGGTEVDVYIYRGPTLEIRLSSQSCTRVLIYQKASIPVKISGGLQKAPLALSEPQLAAYAVYAEDEGWAQRFFSEAELPAVLYALMVDYVDWPIFRQVEIQPGEVMLYLHRSTRLSVNPSQFSAAQAWIGELARLERIITAQPAPSVVSRPIGGSSRQERQRKSKCLLFAVLTILIGLPVALAGIGVLSYLLVSH